MTGLSNLQRDSGGGKRPWELRLLFWVVIAAVGSVVVITGAYYFDVATESRYFCGVLCHPNRPQYVAQEVSPHADLECGVCHVGPGLFPKVQAKIAGAKELYLLVTNLYDRPIEHPVSQLKGADVICEQCHTPDQFYEDQIEQISRFAADEANSETEIGMVLRIGGGRELEGVTAAHWHIDHPVWYIGRDPDKQDIAWAAVMGSDGQLVEYEATENPLTAGERASLTQREMDCMDCHNRATHQFRNPEEWVNEAMASGSIDSDLPFVKREAMELLTASYDTQEAGLAAMGSLTQFYQSEYPPVYADQEQEIKGAVEVLQDIYEHTTFPSMNLTWDYYPDNLGHVDFPGCFRCHDGTHVNAQEEPIPNNCTLCHSVPIARNAGASVEPSQVVNAVLGAPKPDSHLEVTFIWEHRLLANDSCADCHGAIEYGSDNSSFCANGICHGQEWPEPIQFADFQHPVQLVDAHAEASCNECHQGVREPELEDCATCHQPPERPHFGSECASCHTPAGWAESAASWVANAPNNPHGIETVDCLLCHDEGGAKPAPATHGGIPSGSCSSCHEAVSVAQIPVIPHTIAEEDGCLACHSQGDLQPTSVLHRGIPAESCLQCHTSEPIAGVPIIPHAGDYGARCLACHDVDGLVPVPSGHVGWSGDACLLCHEPSSPE